MKKDQEIFIAQQVAELRGLTIKGFEGVNERLDRLNGKVAEHERRLNYEDITHAEEKGERKGVSNVWKFLITALTLIIGFLTYIALAKP